MNRKCYVWYKINCLGVIIKTEDKCNSWITLSPNPITVFFPLLLYLNGEWRTITAVTAFFAVADRSHHAYVSTCSNKKVFCQQGYLPD